MKFYISADIEGVAGICDPAEADPQGKAIAEFQDQMTREVAAACEAAVSAGATEILVKDAHAHARNIRAERLPQQARVVRGWTGHPFAMMAELDESFAAVGYVGYHARAGSGGNPLSHTMSGRNVWEIRVNGEPASEFLLNTYTATWLGVPVVFLSGDEALCREVEAYNKAIETVAVLRGVGTATVSLHPQEAARRIGAGVREALGDETKRSKKAMRPLPESFRVEIDFKHPRTAYGASFYPGAKLERERTVVFEARDYFEVLRMLHFTI